MAEELFTVTITALHGPEARDLASRFLAMVFKNRSLEEISRALTTLPLLITSDVSRAAADTLRKHLEARGATVLIESYLWPTTSSAPVAEPRAQAQGQTGFPAYGAASGATGTTPAATAASMPSSSPTGPVTLATETSYAYKRPGHKDRIHLR